MPADIFKANDMDDDGGRLEVVDNYSIPEKMGRELYFWGVDKTGEHSHLSIAREDAERLYAWLGKWLGKSEPTELVREVVRNLPTRHIVQESYHESYREPHPRLEDYCECCDPDVDRCRNKRGV